MYRSDPPSPRWPLHTLGAAAVAATLLLLGAGALVNARQAGLSVPDWPTSYGRWLLVGEWTGNAILEHTHRLLAAATGLILVIFLPAAWRARGVGAPERAWALGAGALYAAQVLAGGAVVLLLSPWWLTAGHVVMAQLLVVAVSRTALLMSRDGPPAIGGGVPSELLPVAARRARRLTGLLLLQVALGALSRHPAAPAPQIVTLLAHLAIGLTVGVYLPLTAIPLVRRTRGPARNVGWLLLALLAGQLAVAAPLFVVAPEPLAEEWPPPSLFPELHVAHGILAALLLATAVHLAAQLRHQRRMHPEDAAG